MPSTSSLLIVDDEPDFLELMTDMLDDGRLQILTAAHPDAALAVLHETDIDVALVDLQMPKGGGRRLLGEMQRLFPQVCSIVLTAYGSESIAVEMIRELSVYHYFSKTDLDEDRLVAAIRGAMRSKVADAIVASRDFEILGERQEDIWTLYPVGFLSAQPKLMRLPLLANAVDAARQRGEMRILVDLSLLRVAVGVAMGYLVGASRRLERSGGKLAVFGADRSVARSLLRLDRSRLGQHGLPVYSGRQAAVEALRA